MLWKRWWYGLYDKLLCLLGCIHSYKGMNLPPVKRQPSNNNLSWEKEQYYFWSILSMIIFKMYTCSVSVQIYVLHGNTKGCCVFYWHYWLQAIKQYLGLPWRVLSFCFLSCLQSRGNQAITTYRGKKSNIIFEVFYLW
jgi:hypothetical protein